MKKILTLGLGLLALSLAPLGAQEGGLKFGLTSQATLPFDYVYNIGDNPTRISDVFTTGLRLDISTFAVNLNLSFLTFTEKNLTTNAETTDQLLGLGIEAFYLVPVAGSKFLMGPHFNFASLKNGQDNFSMAFGAKTGFQVPLVQNMHFTFTTGLSYRYVKITGNNPLWERSYIHIAPPNLGLVFYF